MKKGQVFSVEVQGVTFTAIITGNEASDNREHIRTTFNLTRSDTGETKKFAVIFDNQPRILNSAHLAEAPTADRMWKFPKFEYEASDIVWAQATIGFAVK
jgi:hypothetical protein